MLDQDLAVTCLRTDNNHSASPEIGWMDGVAFGVRGSLQCPPVPPEFLDANGRLDLSKCGCIGTDVINSA